MNETVKKLLFHKDIYNVGFCRFSDVKDHLIDCRAKSRIPNGAKTVIMVFFPYRTKKEKPQNISRYAAVPDYHKICGRYLEEGIKALREEFKDFCFEGFIDKETSMLVKKIRYFEAQPAS